MDPNIPLYLQIEDNQLCTPAYDVENQNGSLRAGTVYRFVHNRGQRLMGLLEYYLVDPESGRKRMLLYENSAMHRSLVPYYPEDNDENRYPIQVGDVVWNDQTRLDDAQIKIVEIGRDKVIGVQLLPVYFHPTQLGFGNVVVVPDDRVTPLMRKVFGSLGRVEPESTGPKEPAGPKEEERSGPQTDSPQPEPEVTPREAGLIAITDVMRQKGFILAPDHEGVENEEMRHQFTRAFARTEARGEQRNYEYGRFVFVNEETGLLVVITRWFDRDQWFDRSAPASGTEKEPALTEKVRITRNSCPKAVTRRTSWKSRESSFTWEPSRILANSRLNSFPLAGKDSALN